MKKEELGRGGDRGCGSRALDAVGLASAQGRAEGIELERYDGWQAKCTSSCEISAQEMV